MFLRSQRMNMRVVICPESTCGAERQKELLLVAIIVTCNLPITSFYYYHYLLTLLPLLILLPLLPLLVAIIVTCNLPITSSYYYPLPWRAINVREVVCFFSTLSSTFFSAARKSTTYNFRPTNYVGSFTFYMYNQIPLYILVPPVSLYELISWHFCQGASGWFQIRSSQRSINFWSIWNF